MHDIKPIDPPNLLTYGKFATILDELGAFRQVGDAAVVGEDGPRFEDGTGGGLVIAAAGEVNRLIFGSND